MNNFTPPINVDDSLLPLMRKITGNLQYQAGYSIETAAAIVLGATTLVKEIATLPVRSSLPDGCVSTETFATWIEMNPDLVRWEYLTCGSFYSAIPVHLPDGSLAWTLGDVYEVMDWLNT